MLKRLVMKRIITALFNLLIQYFFAKKLTNAREKQKDSNTTLKHQQQFQKTTHNHYHR
jgi:hypothetical protein